MACKNISCSASSSSSSFLAIRTIVPQSFCAYRFCSCANAAFGSSTTTDHCELQHSPFGMAAIEYVETTLCRLKTLRRIAPLIARSLSTHQQLDTPR